MRIHPTSVIEPKAEIDDSASIGPFCYVESGASIGSGCQLHSHVVVKRGTSIQPDTVVCERATLGGLPQHINVPEQPGRLIIGRRNMIRENVTIHCSLREDGITQVGDDCLLMVGAHIAHDCVVGQHVILTNNVLLGGHVQVDDRACLGGAVAVHQHCRIGQLAMIAGCARVVQDVPPFVLTDDAAMIVGLNRVGLRRAGFSRQEIARLKEAYQLIYRQGLSFDETLAALDESFEHGHASQFANFFRGGTRGFVQERRSPPRTVIRIHPALDDEMPAAFGTRRMAG